VADAKFSGEAHKFDIRNVKKMTLDLMFEVSVRLCDNLQKSGFAAAALTE
jgi:hypothetical protein